jgi:hypothetical protein
MFRAHVTKVSAVLLLTLALGAISAPAQAAGFSSEGPSRWEQLAQSFFGWLLKYSACIDPNGGAALSLDDSGMIDPNGKAAAIASPAGAATLCLDTSSCIEPNGRQ